MTPAASPADASVAVGASASQGATRDASGGASASDGQPRSDESYPRSDVETWFMARMLQPSPTGQLGELTQEEAERGFRGTFTNPLSDATDLRGWAYPAFSYQLRVLRFSATGRIELRNADTYAPVAPTSPDVKSMLDDLRRGLPPSTFPPKATFEVQASRSRDNGDLTEKHLLHDPVTGVYVFVFSFGG